MCVSAGEITRKQLAGGRQLLFPAFCGCFGWVGGGRQQDAMGEKRSSGSAAAALGQDPHTGQGQVGSVLCWVKLL